MSFFAELKRRNVFKVGAAYAIVAWLLIQVASVLLPTFHTPEWVMQAFTVLLILGLPVALILAWAYELTPEGIKLTGDVDTPAMPKPRRYHTRRLGVALGIVVLLLAAYTFKTAIHDQSSTAGPSHQIRSLAVLPLENLSGDPQQEYFANGMTEELITDLSKISALRVISRTSVMVYKGSKKSLPEIARELNVEAVVEGSVEKAGDRVRINAQLIDASQDRNLWAQTYDGALKNVLDLQSEVAETIAQKIQIKVTPQEQQRLAAVPPVNPDAHNDYELGQYHLAKITRPEILKSREYFKLAIQKQPDYAKAYLAMARSYAVMTPSYLSPLESGPKVRAGVLKALQLDPNLAEAHAALGGLYLSYGRQWDKARNELDRALELDANSAVAHENLAAYFAAIGKEQKAAREMKRAQELDPLSVRSGTVADRSLILYMAHQDDMALDQCRRALEVDPGKPCLTQPYIELQRGENARALADARKGTEMGKTPFYLENLGMVEASLGMREDALRVIDVLKNRSRNEYVCLYEVAVIYATLGDKDSAFQFLDKAVADRDVCMIWLAADRRLKGLHSDPRFTMLEQEIGFTEKKKYTG